MKCHSVDRKVSAFIDGVLPERDAREVSQHLARCTRCATRSEQLGRLRNELRALPVPRAPEQLTVDLQVIASREMARRADRASRLDRFRLHVSELMRPLALPFAGGLVSTVVLFSMLVPTFAGLGKPTVGDIPTVLATDPMLMSSASFGLGDDEIVVDLIVDEQGRMVDYSIPDGQPWMKNPEIRRGVENTLLLTRFAPATRFSFPTPGKTRIVLRRSHVEVKG